jgi:hypothetical protein
MLFVEIQSGEGRAVHGNALFRTPLTAEADRIAKKETLSELRARYLIADF